MKSPSPLIDRLAQQAINFLRYLTSKDWRLKIKFVQLRDAGFYECAVSSHPSISLFVQLDVTESKAEIAGPQEKYLKPGSTLKLSCRVVENIENPLFLFWYHNQRMINYDSHLGINVTIDLGKCMSMASFGLFQIGFHCIIHQITNFRSC